MARSGYIAICRNREVSSWKRGYIFVQQLVFHLQIEEGDVPVEAMGYLPSRADLILPSVLSAQRQKTAAAITRQFKQQRRLIRTAHISEDLNFLRNSPRQPYLWRERTICPAV